MTHPADAEPTPPATPAPPVARSRWLRFYAVLAAFNVFTVCLALYLTHHLMGLYAESVAVNSQWVARGNAYSQLARLAADANAPGNNVFQSREVEDESRRLALAAEAFESDLTALRQDVQQNLPASLRASMETRIDAVDAAMTVMTGEAGLIFDAVRRDDLRAAGQHMASMDRAYREVIEGIDRLRIEKNAIQEALFKAQLAAANRLRAIEWVLAAMILLMIAAALAYGRRLGLQAERQASERERQLRELEVTQSALAAAHDELEDRVRQRTVELDSFFDLSLDMLCIASPDGHFLRLNPAWEAVLGHSREELMSSPFLDFVHPDDVASTRATLEGLRKGVNVSAFENRYRCKDGSYRWLVWQAAPAPDQTLVFAAAHDVTERKRAEEALRLSEDRLQIVSRATNDAVWDLNLLTDELWFNESFEHTFGYVAGSYEPTLEFWIEKIHPDDREAISASFDAFIAGDAERWTGEYRFQRADGSYAHVLDRALIQRDAQGKGTRMVGSMLDVTMQVEQQAELREAKLQAERANRAKGDFLANMSHEIRTPMNGVLGTLGLLLDTSLTGTQRELAGLARASGETLLSLINDILDFSKIEAGKLSLEPIAFDLLRASEGVADMMATLAAGKDLDLVLRYAPDVPRHVVGDPGRIRQVLTNLISNAIKFTDTGQVLVDVEAESVDEDAVSLRIRVEDTGQGIAAEQLAHVFDKFTQADASTTRRHGGSGLGLAISAQLVELMGGMIGVDSTPGRGSTFWFTLRLPLQKDAPPPMLPPVDLQGVRVLIVDDNEVNRRVLHEQVVSWKMRNGSCATASEALKALRAAHEAGDPYQIAILDYQMPGTDGEALGRAIKNDPDLRDVSLLMLTSMGQRGDVARMKTIGFAGYLVKPARQSVLLDALEAVWSARLHKQETGMVTRHSLLEERALRETETPSGPFTARVLLAEDQPTNQVVASMMLRKLGCTVDLANNGREALEMLERAHYDIVFMDCEMPVMDGFEATETIRMRPDDRSEIPIIAVTAQAMQGDRERCLRAGMNDYISKPVQSASFAAALKQWAPAHAPSASGAEAPAHAPAAQAATGLDAAVVARLRALALDTDPQLLEQIFTSFERDGAERILALQEAVQRGDALALRKAAHALKGASGSIGAHAMAGLSEQLEAAGQAGRLAGVAVLVEQAQAEFVRVIGEIAGIRAASSTDARDTE